MKHITAKTAAIRELLAACQDEETLTGKAMLFGSIRFLIEDVCKDQSPSSYARDKAFKLGAHSAAIFGFDQDYGMSVGSHLTAAAVELASMESALLQQYR